MIFKSVASTITKVGQVALVSAAVAYVFGWWLGWIELMVVVAGVVLAFVVAVAFTLGRFRLRIERFIEPERVTVGEPSFARLSATNDRVAPSPPVSVMDWIGDSVVPVDIPVLGSHGTKEVTYSLPTHRRGIVDVGPVMIAKRDPLGLLSREARLGGKQRLWIHPKVMRLPPLPVGFAKDLEGPTSDMSPKGDVAFHTLREYVPGDEYRHIHWKTSARLGTLMVRQYVDNRRPHLTIVLDTRPDGYDDSTFELAVSCVASLVVSSLAVDQSISAYAGATPVIGALARATKDGVLDHLAGVERTAGNGDLPRTVATAVSSERATSTTVVVAGALPSNEVAALGVALPAVSRLVVTRAIPSDQRPLWSFSGIDVLNPGSLDEFRRTWIRVVQ